MINLDIFISADGRVLWEGKPRLGGVDQDVFLDFASLSQPLLGGNRWASTLGFTAAAEPLWEGRGAADEFYWDLFVGDFNLSKDALRPLGVPYETFGGVGNSRGQILWAAQRDGMMELWLSTPVPEPSVLLLGVPLLLLARRRR